MSVLEEAMSRSELIKIKGYLESQDTGKIAVAHNKIDKFIMAYLKSCKHDYKVNKLNDALNYLELTHKELIEQNADNVVIQAVIEKFKEHKELREKINKTENTTEKERLIRLLRNKNMWEI